ncbi:MerR family transcriptional regulator [bacterium]|nr:MAG: MerR family transcriptional regulator [bacterium]
MKKWQVKEFSELAKISVRTLHHYDEIGLLKPSLRSSNGYRLYSEQDLLKLGSVDFSKM